MGQEALCAVTIGRKRSRGRALLETDALLFRGDVRLSIPFRDVRAVASANGRLSVTYSGGTAVFDLGPQAERWAERIRSPKGLLDKLGVKPGARVAVLGVRDAQFLADLRARARDVSTRMRDGAEVVFLGAGKRADLARLAAVRRRLAPNGAVWVVNPKGVREITEGDVLAAGKAAGLVDVKVARFSDTHTSHKLVIPQRLRNGAGAPIERRRRAAPDGYPRGSTGFAGRRRGLRGVAG